ncbi:hypothetical protein CR983_02155 [Candidatus Saccharibacteria bacterium]|nr:MAG: hypothetical protein CR983_02155 [Candidatus Saccharibacteria bacterium]
MELSDIIVLLLLLYVAALITYLSFASQRSVTRQRAERVFIDTSVLMDGRIMAIVEAGFFPGLAVVPRSVVGELQLLADNGDSEKRERARRALDVIKALQSIEGFELELMQDDTPAREGVDARLLKLARQYDGKLCTIDFNLNKVAQVEGIDVLNVNELAQQLRMTYLPGEKLTLELTSKGSDSHQAVGHLDDGTMVVVEQARKLIGSSAQVEIIRSLQTAAGRMMFARLVSAKQPAAAKKNQTREPVRPPKQRPAPARNTTKSPNSAAAGNQASQKRPAKTRTPRPNAPSSTPRQSSPRRKSALKQEASFVELANRSSQ